MREDPAKKILGDGITDTVAITLNANHPNDSRTPNEIFAPSANYEEAEDQLVEDLAHAFAFIGRNIFENENSTEK